MKLSRKVLIWIISLALFGIWWGVPTFNKWHVDKLVNELCAKDGGIKVYEHVILSSNMFDEYGEVYVPSKMEWKPFDKYYYVSETKWIIPESGGINNLDLRRYQEKLYRVADEKILAEGIGYARRGGDPIGPWHPSHYSCPSQSSIKYVNKKTFLHN